MRTSVALGLGALLVSIAATVPAALGGSNPAVPVAAAASPTIQAVCGPAAPGYARCLTLLRTDIPAQAESQITPLAAPPGYAPADLQSAYALPSSTAGAGETVAIVDAHDQPNAESDLGVYRTQYGLSACTTANGCFRKVNQTGATSPLPAANSSWGVEISLDIEMVSAICPNCHILLVEANSASFANLAAAVNTAATASGVVAVSNSYGGGDGGESVLDSSYNHPGVAVTASSGDSGYGNGSPEYPAASRYVVAVGGTTLSKGGGTRGWTETAWSGAGSGCSSYASKPLL